METWNTHAPVWFLFEEWGFLEHVTVWLCVDCGLEDYRFQRMNALFFKTYQYANLRDCIKDYVCMRWKWRTSVVSKFYFILYTKFLSSHSLIIVKHMKNIVSLSQNLVFVLNIFTSDSWNSYRKYFFGSGSIFVSSLQCSPSYPLCDLSITFRFKHDLYFVIMKKKFLLLTHSFFN